MMNAFRNLYRINDETRARVALVTEDNEAAAVKKYKDNGGKVENATAFRLSFGYDKDVCDINR